MKQRKHSQSLQFILIASANQLTIASRISQSMHTLVMSWRAGVQFSAARRALHSTPFDTSSGGHPASHTMSVGVISKEGQGHEIGQSSPSSAMVKNRGAMPHYPISIHGVEFN
jgi:hypothetical protein